MYAKKIIKHNDVQNIDSKIAAQQWRKIKHCWSRRCKKMAQMAVPEIWRSTTEGFIHCDINEYMRGEYGRRVCLVFFSCWATLMHQNEGTNWCKLEFWSNLNERLVFKKKSLAKVLNIDTSYLSIPLHLCLSSLFRIRFFLWKKSIVNLNKIPRDDLSDALLAFIIFERSHPMEWYFSKWEKVWLNAWKFGW